MEYESLNRINVENLPWGDRSLWSNHEGEAMTVGCQGLTKQPRGSFIHGELAGVLEDSPGLTLPLVRGDPKDSS